MSQGADSEGSFMGSTPLARAHIDVCEYRRWSNQGEVVMEPLNQGQALARLGGLMELPATAGTAS